MEEFQEGSMFHTGAKGGNDDEATKKIYMHCEICTYRIFIFGHSKSPVCIYFWSQQKPSMYNILCPHTM